MAVRDAGTAPITVRTVEDCPEFNPARPHNSGCRSCRSGRSNHCRHPYRKGKTRRDNITFRVRHQPEIM